MLFEDLYLNSFLLLLSILVFVFLALLTIIEWSGKRKCNMTMNEHSQEEAAHNANDPNHLDDEFPLEDKPSTVNGNENSRGEEEPNGSSQDASFVGSNYNNKAPTTESQALVDRYISKVDFNMKSEDLDKPWFHKAATRAVATELLKGRDQGTFLVRPSSQRGSYAMSWVKDIHNGESEISHSLIHGLFPGFALKQSPPLEERYLVWWCYCGNKISHYHLVQHHSSPLF